MHTGRQALFEDSGRSRPAERSSNGCAAQVLVVGPFERLSYSWNASGEVAAGTEYDCNLNAHTYKGRRSRAHGAVGLPARRRGQLPGATDGWQRYVAGLERVAAGLDRSDACQATPRWRCGIAFALRREFRVIDAAGNIGGEDHFEVGPRRPAIRSRQSRNPELGRQRERISSGFLPFDALRDGKGFAAGESVILYR